MASACVQSRVATNRGSSFGSFSALSKVGFALTYARTSVASWPMNVPGIVPS